MNLTTFELAAIALGAFGTGFFKSTFSMAIGLVLVPVMLLFWPTRFIIGIIAIHMLISDYAVIHRFWKQWEWNLAKLVIPGFYAGIVAGTSILVNHQFGQVSYSRNNNDIRRGDLSRASAPLILLASPLRASACVPGRGHP